MLTPSEVAERIREVAKLRNTSIRSLLIKANLGKNTLSNLSNGSALQYDSLARLADELDCSMDYLAGRTDVLKAEQSIPESVSLDEREQNLLRHFRAVGLDGKARIESVAANEHDRLRDATQVKSQTNEE